VGNTRTCRTNTAKRAPNMLMHHGHVPVQVDTVSIGTLAPSGYGYVNQIKSTTCIEKIKKIQIQGNVQKIYSSIFYIFCLFCTSSVF